MSQDPPALSIVVPAFNEEEVLPQFHARLSAALEGVGLEWEVVYVNDGSKDATLPVMLGLQAGDPRVSVLNLSRNFGKEIALTAGLDHARVALLHQACDPDLEKLVEVAAEDGRKLATF